MTQPPASPLAFLMLASTASVAAEEDPMDQARDDPGAGDQPPSRGEAGPGGDSGAEADHDGSTATAHPEHP